MHATVRVCYMREMEKLFTTVNIYLTLHTCFNTRLITVRHQTCVSSSCLFLIFIGFY